MEIHQNTSTLGAHTVVIAASDTNQYIYLNYGLKSLFYCPDIGYDILDIIKGFILNSI